MRTLFFSALVVLTYTPQVAAGVITEINLSDFDNPKILDFESAALGNVSGTEALFTDFGISEASLTLQAPEYVDDYDSNTTGQALWADEGGLSIVEPGDSDLTQIFALAGGQLDYIFKLSELHSKFGWSAVDQASVSFDVELYNASTLVGSRAITTLSTIPKYIQNTVSLVDDTPVLFDEVRLRTSDSNTGHGIDNLTLESTNVVPEPSSLALLGVGAMGFVGYVRRGRRQEPAIDDAG